MSTDCKTWLNSYNGRQWLTTGYAYSVIYCVHNDAERKYIVSILRQKSDFEWCVNSHNGMHFCKCITSNIRGCHEYNEAYKINDFTKCQCSKCILQRLLPLNEFTESPAGKLYIENAMKSDKEFPVDRMPDTHYNLVYR